MCQDTEQWITRGIGKRESEEDDKDHRKRIEVFKSWLNENVMSTVQNSDSIMVLPFGPHTVHYRDDLPQCVDYYPYCLKDSVHAANVV
jgi:hypothetical protein